MLFKNNMINKGVMMYEALPIKNVRFRVSKYKYLIRKLFSKLKNMIKIINIDDNLIL
tara:strand:+ start:420 stop:590 length:171 start_codon:yes stop_codon:yes gene_type:complete